MSFFKKLDLKLNAALLFIMAASLITLISSRRDLFWKQLAFWVVGFVIIFLIVKFDWGRYVSYRGAVFGFYFFIILLLIVTYFLAPNIKGNRAWLVLGPLNLQVAEFSKLMLIIFFAYFFSRKRLGIGKVSNLIASFVYFLIPASLIALQPDFGSALVLFSLWFGFLLVSGIKYRHLVISLIIFCILGLVMWQSVLKDYQKERVLGFFFQNSDPLGVNYSVIQSKIATGSAGVFGKGFGQGSQVQLGFLPEASTDFIFSAFVEEWGWLLGIVLILVFTVLILRIISNGLETNNNFNKFICLGSIILFSSQFILNVGSCLGLTPVIGVTFPFFSYGGSSLLTNLILMGIIQSANAF